MQLWCVWPINRIIRLIIVFLFSSLFWLPCLVTASVELSPNPKNQVPIVLSGNRATVTIDLPAKPASGYQWFLSEYHPSFIRVTRYKHYSDGKENCQPACDEFKLVVNQRFKNAPQKQTIRFTYLKPWAPDEGPIQRSITILSRNND